LGRAWIACSGPVRALFLCLEAKRHLVAPNAGERLDPDGSRSEVEKSEAVNERPQGC
jgi:hypothetical protein